jgi:hypothetical protein
MGEEQMSDVTSDRKTIDWVTLRGCWAFAHFFQIPEKMRESLLQLPSFSVCESQLASSTGAKRTKYAVIANCHDAELIPFVVESCGGLGRDAIALLDVISGAASEHLSFSSPGSVVQPSRSAWAEPVKPILLSAEPMGHRLDRLLT